MEKLPAQMTVVGISKPGGPEVLVPETRAVPVPGPGEILIKVQGRRRQPARRGAAFRRLPAAARRQRSAGP